MNGLFLLKDTGDKMKNKITIEQKQRAFVESVHAIWRTSLYVEMDGVKNVDVLRNIFKELLNEQLRPTYNHKTQYIRSATKKHFDELIESVNSAGCGVGDEEWGQWLKDILINENRKEYEKIFKGYNDSEATRFLKKDEQGFGDWEHDYTKKYFESEIAKT